MGVRGFKMKNAITGVILAFIVMLMAEGNLCAAQKDSPSLAAKKPQMTKETPQYGGVLKIITSYSPVNLGAPWEPRVPTDSIFAQPALECLVRIDEKGLPAVPWLAASWKISKDFKSITFNLRRGVKFHDGTDFNAEAVKANFDMLRKSTSTSTFNIITSIDVVDPFTVRINLSGYQHHIFNTFAQPGFGSIVSPEAIKKGKEFCLLNPIGTGPFKFKSFQRDQSIIFNKFENYWQKGKPYLDRIEWVTISDKYTAVMAFRNGEGQMIWGLEPRDAWELSKEGKVITQAVVATYTLSGDSLHQSSPYSDIRVRRAVDYAINKKAIADALGYGFYRPANQLATKENWFFNSSIKGFPYNPQKAKELLTEAGYANGFKTKIITLNTYPSSVYVAIQSDLAKVGIQAEIEAVAPGLYTQTSTKGWENALFAAPVPNGVGIDPAGALNNTLSGKTAYYVSVARPSEFLQKLQSAMDELDLKKRTARFIALEKSIIDQYTLIIPTYVGFFLAGKNAKVHGAKLSEEWYQQWTPGDAWLSK